MQRKQTLRAIVYGLLLLATLPTIESYGCACGRRTYTSLETAWYRTGAALNRLSAIEEMETYHGWRQRSFEEGSDAYLVEVREQRRYFERQLLLDSRRAVNLEVRRLYGSALTQEGADPLGLLESARSLLARSSHADSLTMFDLRTGEEDVNATSLIGRELGYARAQGSGYQASFRRERSAANARHRRYRLNYWRRMPLP